MKAIPFIAEFEIKKHSFENTNFFIEGYVSTTDYDLQGHKITPDAIRLSRDDLLTNSTVLLNHDPNRAIGKIVATKFNSHGLWVRAEVSAAEPDIRQKIREGVLNKFSIRGKVLDADNEVDTQTKQVAKVIKRMYLTEASLVSCPANPSAEIVDWNETKKSLLGSIVKALNEGGEDMTMKPEEVIVEKSGFPVPDVLAEQWQDFIRDLQLADDSEKVEKAWGDFCKQYGYPYPYPYPYPESGAKYPYPKTKYPKDQNGYPYPTAKEIGDIVDELVKGEKDENRKKQLLKIKEKAMNQNPTVQKDAAGAVQDPPAPAAAPAPAPQAAAPAPAAPAAVAPVVPVDPMSDPKVQAAIDAKVAERVEEEKKKFVAAPPVPPRKGVVDQGAQNAGIKTFQEAPPMNRLRVAVARKFESEGLLKSK